MKFVALLILLCASCGDFAEIKCKYKFSTSGLDICSEGNIYPEDIDMAVAYLEERVSDVYPQVQGLVSEFQRNDVDVLFVKADLAVECEEIDDNIYKCEQWVSGVNTDYGDIMYVMHRECLAYTAFAHELLHSIDQFYLNNVERTGHGAPWFFMTDHPNDQYSTVEWWVDRQLSINSVGCWP